MMRKSSSFYFLEKKAGLLQIAKALAAFALIMAIGWCVPKLIYTSGSGGTSERYALQEARSFVENPMERMIITHYQVDEVNSRDWRSQDFKDVPPSFKARVSVYTFFGIKYATLRITSIDISKE